MMDLMYEIPSRGKEVGKVIITKDSVEGIAPPVEEARNSEEVA
jgi:ATP-dependent protease Clp ATPase subunit